MFGFQSLIEPLSIDEFLDNYYERFACHIPGNAEKFGRLFGWDDVNTIVNDRLAGHSKVKLVLDKRTLAPESLGRIDHWLREGATLVIDTVNSLDPVLKRFTDILGRDLNMPAWINTYVSWPEKQGFDNHFDTHDVFIVQTEGRKRWTIFNPTKILPLDQQREQPKGEPPPDSEKYLECVLTEGDVLYIPRGHWHYAVSETPSIHLTVGLSSRSPTEFLQWLTQRMRDADPFWRKNFPVAGAAQFGGERPPEHLAEHLDEFRNRLRALADDDGLMERLLEYCMAASPLAREYQLPTEAMVSHSLTPDMVFEPPPAQKFLVSYDPEERRVVALARGHVLDLRNIPRAVADRVFKENAPFSGRDLEACRASFTWDKAKPFLERLYQEGLLRLVPDD
ncbi:MAG: cupin domain-containing protein [Gammaproteobacteria bacterium]|nr:cupin domain-containing protein [Gammaproteobacteria bacterium]